MVPAVGRFGGLALLWDTELSAKILYVDSWIVHVCFQFVNARSSFLYTGVYASNDVSTRRLQWFVIDALKPINNDPWICRGDFNNILKQSEKRGGRAYPYNVMNDFHNMIDGCNLMEMGFVGSPFTWCNYQLRRHIIHSRLDRVLCNTCWCTSNPDLTITHIPTFE